MLFSIKFSKLKKKLLFIQVNECSFVDYTLHSHNQLNSLNMKSFQRKKSGEKKTIRINEQSASNLLIQWFAIAKEMKKKEEDEN